jgi:hypothetical protein
MNPVMPITHKIRYWLARTLFYGGLGAAFVIAGWHLYLGLVMMFGDSGESWSAWQLRLGLGFILLAALGVVGLGIALDFEKRLPRRRRRSE